MESVLTHDVKDTGESINVKTVMEDIVVNKTTTTIEHEMDISSADDYFSASKPGDKELCKGKQIKDVITSSSTYIVYIDDQDEIQWSIKKHRPLGAKFGTLQNKISLWASISDKVFLPKDAFNFKRLLAEGYARILDEGNSESANEIVDATIKSIKKQGEEILRQCYIKWSFFTAMFVIVSIVITVCLKRQVVPDIISQSVYTIFLTGLFGGVGALISTFTRSRNYNADINISKNVHRIDGIMRIVFGVFAGIITSLAIKSNMLFGFIDESAGNAFIEPFLGAIAGASEVILPNIIRQVESKTSAAPSDEAAHPTTVEPA